MPIFNNNSQYLLLVTAKYHVNPFLAVPDWKPYELSWELDPGDSAFVFNNSLLEVKINMYLARNVLISDSNEVAHFSLTNEQELNSPAISITNIYAEEYVNKKTNRPKI